MHKSESDANDADTEVDLSPGQGPGRLLLVVQSEDMAGLRALAGFEGTSGDEPGQLEKIAELVMRRGLAASLEEAGLSSSFASARADERLPANRTQSVPLPEAVEYRGGTIASRDRQVSQPDTTEEVASRATPAIQRHERFKLGALAALAIATLVVLLGGYVAKWSWTGFSRNDELWDWLQLLLLPIALATVPLWLSFGDHMSRTRKAALVGFVVAFVGFVVAGYMVPIGWTGFSGNTLWNWLTLIALPIAVVTIRAWPGSPHEMGPTHVAVFSVLAIAWLVTLVGGYSAPWRWTGYPGNTLWDWLQLLLAPLVIATILVPKALRWIGGDAARVAEAAERDKAARAIGAGAAPHAGQAAAQRRS